MILKVPVDGGKYFPTLGPQLADFMEQNLVFGPGDLKGQPLVLDNERLGLLYHFYEVFPRDHEQAGRRCFQRVGLSLAKGKAKTEFAALIAACELHPDAPVRCVGWTDSGEPIGGPVDDPYIPLIATSEEQSDDLAYGALKAILENSTLKDDFVILDEKIERKRGSGVALSLSSSPNARDGARTTFTVFDETHRWTSARMRHAHQTMLNNLPKRKKANAWALEITTAPEPGAGSVAEATMNYAKAILSGQVKSASFFYFHLQASETHDLETPEGRRAAVIEASGEAAEWRDIEAILNVWDDPETDRPYWMRVWCNLVTQGSTQAFDVEQYKALARPKSPVKKGDLITLGFDGAMFHDSTSLTATHVETGYQWTPGLWECPPGGENLKPRWQVPTADVDTLVRKMFEDYNVWRMYADPPYWQSWISSWIGDFGKERVIEWWTNRWVPMHNALEGFKMALTEGHLTHDGNKQVIRHIGNARKLELNARDDQDKKRWIIQKDRSDSPNKMDAAMSSTLSWEARTDAIAAGVLKTPVPVEKKFQMIILGAGPK